MNICETAHKRISWMQNQKQAELIYLVSVKRPNAVIQSESSWSSSSKLITTEYMKIKDIKIK